MSHEAMAATYKERYRERLATMLAIPAEKAEISDRLAAILFARDLMAGDPEKFKAGYTAPNAAIAAAEIFEGVSREEIEEAL